MRRILSATFAVMAGLVPAIHGCSRVTDVDPRGKS
jgi:hypothetical protein